MSYILQHAAQLANVLAFLGATTFTLFVLWPGIRRQNRTAEKIDRLVEHLKKKSVDNMFK